MMATVESKLEEVAQRLCVAVSDVVAVIVGRDINMQKVDVYGDERIAQHMRKMSLFVSHHSINEFDVEMEEKPNIRQATRFGLHYEKDEPIGKVIIGYPK